MKKLIILSVAIMLVASCGSGGYSTVTRNNNNSTQGATPTGSDPAANFNTLWISEGTPHNYDYEKRGLANFFGYNTAHYSNITDGCFWGYTDETTNYYVPGYTAPCFSPSSSYRNYFNASSSLIQPFPAPKDLGSVSSYSIRFAADVDSATRELIPGNAYLQITIYSTNETLRKEFTTMKAPMTVTSSVCGGVDCELITASFKDDCGSAIFHATSFPSTGGTLTDAYVTFKQDKSSYKKGSCYYDGHLPNDLININNELSDSLPNGIALSSDSGHGMLFIDGVADFIEQ